MKVVQINVVYRHSSTGRTTMEMHQDLLLKGIESYVFTSMNPEKEHNVYPIGGVFDHKLHALCSRIFGLQGYFSHIPTMKLVRQLKNIHPDVVILRNLHSNYINLPMLFRYLAKEQVNVMIVLHDCWFFTGKCTHFTARKCDKWKTVCHHCPALKADLGSWFFDFSRRMFNDRMKWYKALKSLTIVAVSDWEKNLAAQSPLFSNATITRIYNWIDTDTFKPATDEQIQDVSEKYGLSKEKKHVITVSSGWSPVASRTKDALAFAQLLPNNYDMIVVGGGEGVTFPDNVITIPYTSNPSELAALYTLSTAYLHFSVEDTFGKVIAEAMACGTVPIVFDSTACGETASPYGIAVQPHDVKAMIEALPKTEEEERKSKVAEFAANNYLRETNISDYITNFEHILN